MSVILLNSTTLHELLLTLTNEGATALGYEPPLCNRRPCSLNMYAKLGLFSGVSVWIFFMVLSGGVIGLMRVTIWLP